MQLVSADSPDRRVLPEDLHGRGDRSQGVAGIEARLETLADEMGRLIESGPRDEREALHDFAVSLVRDQSPASHAAGERAAPLSPVEEEPAAAAAASLGTNAATLVGYGVLLVPVAFVLTPVLPPIGIMLGLTAGVMVASGAGLAVISRVRSLFA